MKTIEQQIAVMQHFAAGGQAECISVHIVRDMWARALTPSWNWGDFDYRIKEVVDPYAELKAAAKDPTKQLRVKGGRWVAGGDRPDDWKWRYPPHQYEIRNKPRTVKLLAWYDGTHLIHREESKGAPVRSTSKDGCKHVPSEDKTIEVES